MYGPIQGQSSVHFTLRNLLRYRIHRSILLPGITIFYLTNMVLHLSISVTCDPFENAADSKGPGQNGEREIEADPTDDGEPINGSPALNECQVATSPVWHPVCCINLRYNLVHYAVTNHEFHVLLNSTGIRRVILLVQERTVAVLVVH